MSRYRCPECGYLYDEDAGDAFEGYAPGTLFDSLPDDIGTSYGMTFMREQYIREHWLDLFDLAVLPN